MQSFRIVVLVSSLFVVLISILGSSAAGEKETAGSPGQHDREHDAVAALQERIRSLVAGLDSDRFVVREEATRELTKIGGPAIEAIEGAMKSGHFETRRRARVILIDLGKFRRSVSIPSVHGETVVPLKGAFTLLRIGHIAEDGQVVCTTQLDAEEIIIDSVEGRGQLTLAGKAKRVHLGRIAGDAKIDVSSLHVEEFVLGAINDSAEVKVKSLDAVQLPVGIGMVFSPEATGITVRRLPVVREESPTLVLYNALESVCVKFQQLAEQQKSDAVNRMD